MIANVEETRPVTNVENEDSIGGKSLRFDSSQWAAVQEQYARLTRDISINNPLYWILGMPRNVYGHSECEICMLAYSEAQYHEYIQMRKDVLRTESSQDVLSMVASHHRMPCMYCCMDYFLSRAGYEECLVAAWTTSKIDNSMLSLNQKLELFDEADLDKLLAAGDPLPPDDSLTIYRGCSGGGKNLNKAREAMSWTLSLDVAEWFAVRFEKKPVVYKATISRADVLFYSNQMNEQEVVTVLSDDASIEMIRHSGRTLDQLNDLKRQRANPTQLSLAIPAMP